jgi:hypothetical protein
VLSAIGIVRPNNLSGIIDAVGVWAGALWRIDAGVLPVAINKTVLWRDSATGLIKTGDLSFIIDTYRHGANCAGKFDRGVSTMAIQPCSGPPLLSW